MDRLNNDDIEELTKAAERGNGTQIKQVLSTIGSLEERSSILWRMDECNEKHRKTDPQLPDLIISTCIPYRARYVLSEIQHDPPGWFNTTTLYSETYYPGSGKKTIKSNDTKK